MDPFQKMLDDLGSGDQEVNKAKMESLKKVCVCPLCPSYNKFAEDHGETLYCILGRTAPPRMDELGCICEDCPIATEGGLVNSYYCIHGSESEMRKERRLPRRFRKERQ